VGAVEDGRKGSPPHPTVVATADVIAGRCPPADLEEALAVAVVGRRRIEGSRGVNGPEQSREMGSRGW